MPDQNIRVHSFTLRATGIANVLHTPFEIALPQKVFDYKNATKTSIRGIWDTGASNTVITQNVVDALELKPTGKAIVNTASERNKTVDTFLVDIFLQPELRVSGVQVTIGVLVDGIDCLIGMDIINLGDFSITNLNQRTTMSFRIPSLHEIDYLTAMTGNNPHTSQKVGRNDPCPCGSGKKYKKCCGLNL